MKSFTININGKTEQIEADPSSPLLWVLRDQLDMVGTKFGCGFGQCGACTVHLDGVAINSCILPISQIEGKKITTIEGLSKTGNHPVQEAWKEIDVPQCGYCQAGQIMTAASLKIGYFSFIIGAYSISDCVVNAPIFKRLSSSLIKE